jgi:uncharacterized protein (DUF2249 family)
MNTEVVELDVREFFARGEEPFRAIMAAVAQVRDGGALRLRVPFEPRPLYRVLGNQGFGHQARQLGPRDWEITFRKPGAESLESDPGAIADGSTSGAFPRPLEGENEAPQAGRADPTGRLTAPALAPVRTITIDVSELVPPEPMIRILEAASHLEPGQALRVQHVRRPVYLYPRLDELGYAHETRELEAGKIEIMIRRPADANCC